MRENLRRNLRDIAGGLVGVWVLFYLAIPMDPDLLKRFAEHGISPAVLAAVLAALLATDSVIICGIIVGARFLAIRLARHGMKRSA